MYLQCYTAQEIADVVGIDQTNVVKEISALTDEMETASKTSVTANYQDNFDIPIYNRFSYGSKKPGDTPPDLMSFNIFREYFNDSLNVV